MQRREFITLLGGTVMGWPLTAHAQQAERVRRIGVLMPFTADDPEARERNAVFEQSLQQLGWTVGRNLQIEQRSPGGEARFYPPCHGGTSCARAGGRSGRWHRDRCDVAASNPEPSRSCS